MARRKVFLHLGLAGTGAAFLEPALLAHAEGLAAVGVNAPAVSEAEMFRVALEIRRTHKEHGYERGEVEGSWEELCRRFRRGHGTVVLGQEMLAAADADQAALFLDASAGFDVHLVFTVRDPGTQVLAQWAELVKTGGSLSFAEFREQILAPARDSETAIRFWGDQDVEGVLARWAALVSPPRVHVLPVPRVDDPRAAIWAEFGRLVGFDASAFPLGARAVQPALGSTEVAVLRGVNEAIDDQIDGQLRRTVVKRYFAERVLGSTDARLTRVPADLYDDLVVLAERWQKSIANSGYDVRGSLDDLIPVKPAKSGVAPDDIRKSDRLRSTTDALAQVLVEVARLREHNEQLEIRNAELEKKRKKLKARLSQPPQP
jgi:hypothetical protein